MQRVRALIVEFVFFLFRCAAWVYFYLLNSLRMRGLEHLPREGPYLIAPNHQSSLDGYLAGFRVPGKVHCVVERAYFRRPFVGFLLRTFRGLPLGPGRDRKGYERALEVLREGHPVIVFPEGRRAVDPYSGFDLQAGTARLALTLGVPIVPMTLAGVYEALPKGTLLPRIGRPMVAEYHPPIPCPVTTDREEMKARSAEINDRLAALYRRRLRAWQRLREGRAASV